MKQVSVLTATVAKDIQAAKEVLTTGGFEVAIVPSDGHWYHLLCVDFEAGAQLDSFATHVNSEGDYPLYYCPYNVFEKLGSIGAFIGELRPYEYLVALEGLDLDDPHDLAIFLEYLESTGSGIHSMPEWLPEDGDEEDW